MFVSFAIAIPSEASAVRTGNWKTPPACELNTVAIPVTPDPSLDAYST